MDISTPAGRSAMMTPIVNQYTPILINLFARWQEEKEYEDFKDYMPHLAKVLEFCPKGTIIVKTGKKPFGVTIRIPGFPYDCLIFMAATSRGWKGVEQK